MSAESLGPDPIAATRQLLQDLECDSPSCPCHRSTAKGQGLGHCPGPSHGHGDRNPSLHIKPGLTQPLLKCFAGCSNDAIVEALKASGRWSHAEGRHRWSVRGRDGELLRVHERIEVQGKKSFAWRHPNGRASRGGELASDDVLYGLERLAQKPTAHVVLVEGERAADALWTAGILALGTLTGAASTPSSEALAVLADRRTVALWPDADDVGREHMRRVAGNLPAGPRVVLIDWSGAEPGADAVDYLVDHDRKALTGLLTAAQPLKAPEPAARAEDPAVPWRAQLTPASKIKAKAIDWIWPGRIARGKLTALGGDPGEGKGTLGVDIAARISTGRGWPDGSSCRLTKVALLSGEDDPEDTIRPRLDVAGADVDQVLIIGRIPDLQTGELRRVSLDGDVDPLFRQLAAAGVELLVIDPLSSYLGGETNSWRDNDLRRILDPLAEAAARHAIAVLLVAHLTKAAGSKALYRFQGNVATVAAARLVFLLAHSPDDPDRRVLACSKANIARKPASLVFRLITKRHEVTGDDVGLIEWTGVSTLTADDLLGPPPAQTALELAKAFLLDYLRDGRRPSEDVKDSAKKRNIGRDSLWKAKAELKVRAIKVGPLDRWDWALPDELAFELNHPDDFDTIRTVQDPSGSLSSISRPSSPISPIGQPLLFDAAREVPKDTEASGFPPGAAAHVGGGRNGHSDEELALASFSDADFPGDLIGEETADA